MVIETLVRSMEWWYFFLLLCWLLSFCLPCVFCLILFLFFSPFLSLSLIYLLSNKTYTVDFGIWSSILIRTRRISSNFKNWMATVSSRGAWGEKEYKATLESILLFRDVKGSWISLPVAVKWVSSSLQISCCSTYLCMPIQMHRLSEEWDKVRLHNCSKFYWNLICFGERDIKVHKEWSW